MPDEETPQAKPDEDAELPPELKGKSKREILDFFNKREEVWQRQLARANEAASRTPAVEAQEPSAKSPTASEWWNDPAKAVEETINQQAVTRQEFDAVKSSVIPNLIHTARLTMRSAHGDWDQFREGVERIVATYQPEQQADANNWETAYTYVKGQAYDKAVKEAELRGRMPAERVKPAGTPPEPPREATVEEAYVARGLNITPEKYLEGKRNMEEGKWPLTMNNVRPR